MSRADDTQGLWLEYRRTGNQAIRDRLILTYAPLVKYVAGRLGSGLPAHVDEGDLVSYGLLGLMGAIERYEPDRDVKFETYAIARIKGAIIDELRAMDWVPRSVRSRAREIERAVARAREARRDALLLRGADAAGDRRGARRDRVARLPAPHESDSPLEGAPLGGVRARCTRALDTACITIRLSEKPPPRRIAN